MKPTLFLDIDGVLVNDWSSQQAMVALSTHVEYRPYAPECMEALKYVLQKAVPKVFIMSTRRLQYNAEQIEAIWADQGIEYGPLYLLRKAGENEGVEFASSAAEKAFDVQRHVASANIPMDSFAVVDDEDVPVHNLLRPDGGIGLTKNDAKMIVESLLGGSAAWRH